MEKNVVVIAIAPLSVSEDISGLRAAGEQTVPCMYAAQ